MTKVSGVAGPAQEPAALERARRAVAAVPDPELPMLTVADLGIVREVSLREVGPGEVGPREAGPGEAGSGEAGVDGGQVVVWLTPTYSGCPALREIQQDIRARLAEAGLADAEIRLRLDPPWSADWITADGRRKLAAAGIAPPTPFAGPRRTAGPVPLTLSPVRPAVSCPACGSPRTERTAAFSGTACKDLYRCLACAEPFEHIKEI